MPTPIETIVTHFRKPPIPTTVFDWEAHYDGDEPDDRGSMKVGYGSTEAEAIADLTGGDE